MLNIFLGNRRCESIYVLWVWINIVRGLKLPPHVETFTTLSIFVDFCCLIFCIYILHELNEHSSMTSKTKRPSLDKFPSIYQSKEKLTTTGFYLVPSVLYWKVIDRDASDSSNALQDALHKFHCDKRRINDIGLISKYLYSEYIISWSLFVSYRVWINK